MHILYIWDSDYPWDIRVEKICTSLSRYGHEVYIASRNLKKRRQYEILEGVHVYRLKSWMNDKINYFLSFPAFFNPIWKNLIYKITRRHGIDVIIVRDLPMAVAGVWAGRRHHIPVIFDMAEDYVAMVSDIWKARKFSGLNLIVRNPFFTKLVEQYVLTHVDHTIVVVEEAKELVLKNGGNEDKVTIVGNTPILDSFLRLEGTTNEIQKQIERYYTAVYVGGIQMGRGIQTVLQAIPQIIKKIPDFLFLVVGDGYAKAKLIAHAKDLGVQNYVIWAGWVNHDLIYEHIRKCKVGVIPHFVTDHVNTTMPNKIYDFMGAGIPVIASDSKPMQRLLMTEGCGMTFKSGDPAHLASAIFQIHREGSGRMGRAGAHAVRNYHNWGEDSKRLLEVVDGFCARPAKK
jgi:glycosyltransferase involved in cell wall biosynthesis